MNERFKQILGIIYHLAMLEEKGVKIVMIAFLKRGNF